jgi:ABC-2 type transport system permease protein
MKLLLKTISVEWKMNIRNFLNIFFSLIFPVMMLLLFGSMYGNEPSEYYQGINLWFMLIPFVLSLLLGIRKET